MAEFFRKSVGWDRALHTGKQGDEEAGGRPDKKG
ncbi:MAG: hypothetical protein HW415_1683 [Deltaproteobacteria bacterium]|nr:hypothetical protein [Deltaproteobacteria bacterium]